MIWCAGNRCFLQQTASHSSSTCKNSYVQTHHFSNLHTHWITPLSPYSSLIVHTYPTEISYLSNLSITHSTIHSPCTPSQFFPWVCSPHVWPLRCTLWWEFKKNSEIRREEEDVQSICLRENQKGGNWNWAISHYNTDQSSVSYIQESKDQLLTNTSN